MRPVVLLVNDDGYIPQRLDALIHRLSGEFDLRVVLPASDKSGVGTSIELSHVIATEIRENVFVVSGTPVNCVRYALCVKNWTVDAVLSGPNVGWNVGLDLWSSGTFAAAMEGYMRGVSSVALSLHYQDHNIDDWVAKWARYAINQAITHYGKLLWNMNLPRKHYGEHTFSRITPEHHYNPTRCFVEVKEPGEPFTPQPSGYYDGDLEVLERNEISISQLAGVFGAIRSGNSGAECL